MLELIKTLIRTEPTQMMPIYPYEFNTSGFARVDKVRFIIENQSDWDYAYHASVLAKNNLSAAAYFGFGPNFTVEETALSHMLCAVNAGPHIMTYAWGMYDDLLKSETSSH